MAERQIPAGLFVFSAGSFVNDEPESAAYQRQSGSAFVNETEVTTTTPPQIRYLGSRIRPAAFSPGTAL